MTDPKDPRKTPPDEPPVLTTAEDDGRTVVTPRQVTGASSDDDRTTAMPVAPPPPTPAGPAAQPDPTLRVGEAGTPATVPPPFPATAPSPATPQSSDDVPTQLQPRTGDVQFTPGATVAGRYKIVNVLGVGGMGVVYRAVDESLGIEIALKVLRPEVAQDEEFLERFRNELLIARQVTHRNVVRLHDIGDDQGVYYMSMDLVTGESLQDLLRKQKKLAPEEAVKILSQIAHALAEAHRQGVVHRDLKPANILLQGETGEAFISDFGIARSLSTSGMTRTGVVVGTPHYLSPEQARGEKVEAASDVYALGIIFVEMLSGKIPFAGGTLLEILSQRITGHRQSLEDLGVEVSPAIAAVVDRCLAHDPAERYPSAAELAEELDDLTRPAERRRREERRRAIDTAARIAAIVAAVVLVAFLATRFLTVRSDTATVVEAPQGPRHSIAVLPFRGAEGRDDLAWVSAGVVEMLSASLAESEDLRVVDGQRVLRTLRDLGFSPGAVRDDQFAQLADVFEVDRLVTGQLRATGDVVQGTVQIEARVVELDKPGTPSRPLQPLQGANADLFHLIGELGPAVRSALEVQESTLETAALTASPAAMEAYSRGLELLARDETLAAIPELEKAVEEDAAFGAAWSRLAKAYEDAGRVDEALDAAREAVRADVGGRQGYEARAREAQLRGEYEDAQKFLEELVERYPNDAGAHVALGETFGAAGRFGDAVASLRRAVEIDGSRADAWYLLGRYSIQGGDSQKAVDEYLVQALVRHRTLKNEEGQGDVHNALGVGYQRLGKLDEAAESYRTAAAIRERIGDRRGFAVSLHNLALVESILGDQDDAEANLRKALAIHEEIGNQPGVATAYDGLGTVEEERGDYRKALEAFQQALRIREDIGQQFTIADASNNVGYVYYLLGEYSNAVLFIQRALDLYRSNEDPYGTMSSLQSLGFCQEAQGKWSEASRSFLEALDIAREISSPYAEAVSHGNLGVLARREGRYRAAFESFDEALRIVTEAGDPAGQIEFLLQTAEAYVEVGAADEAGARLARAEDLLEDGGNREDQSKLARLHSRLHLLRGAANAATVAARDALKAAEASKGAIASTQARIELGLARLAASDHDEAREGLRQAAGEAERLGHAALTLRANEGLARTALRLDDAAGAEEAARKALRLVDGGDVTGYAGSYRLRLLLADALALQGKESAAGRARRDAAEDLQKVRAEVPEALRPAFDRFPEVSTLLANG